MRNYVKLWIAGQNDPGPPVSLLQYGFFFSEPEALRYMTDNGWNCGPRGYYFLLSKANVAALVSQYPWAPDENAELPINDQQYLRVGEDVKAWGGLYPLWQADLDDSWSVNGAESAQKTRGRVFSEEIKILLALLAEAGIKSPF